MSIKLLSAMRPEQYLERMKRQYLLEKGDSCHRRVAQAIQQRRNPTDIVWFFGMPPDNVHHSVLTDAHNRVIVGEHEGYPGAFHAERGFDYTENDGEVTRLIFIKKFPASTVLGSERSASVNRELRDKVFCVELWFDKDGRNWVCEAYDSECNPVEDMHDPVLETTTSGTRRDGQVDLEYKLRQLGLDPKDNAKKVKKMRMLRGY